MKKITQKQIKMLKRNMDKMAESNEQFIFILFKNKDGTDNITQYSNNTLADKLEYYFKKAINSGIIKDDK